MEYLEFWTVFRLFRANLASTDHKRHKLFSEHEGSYSELTLHNSEVFNAEIVHISI